MNLIKKLLQFLWIIEQPKDGDKDGKVFDGTPFEQPAHVKVVPAKKKSVKKAPAKKVAKKVK
jgi:hypothetical protein